MHRDTSKENVITGSMTASIEVGEVGREPHLDLADIGDTAIDNIPQHVDPNVGLSGEYDRKKEVYSVDRNSETYEVEITSDLTLEDYRARTPEADWALFEEYVAKLKGKRVVFMNPTLSGGGVAMLRPPLVHLLRLSGVDAHWYVMEKSPEEGPDVFEFTKLMHNISQRRLGDTRISEEGKQMHQEWCRQNAEVLTQQEAIQTADVFICDDPQPAPMKKYLEAVNPDAKWIWRNHIDTSHTLMSDPSTPQAEVAHYIMEECGMKDADAVIAHPVEEFVHPGMEHKTAFAPATTDPFDDLNKRLSSEEVDSGIDFVNQEIDLKNVELMPGDQISHIDPSRRRLTLIARFDESKGMDIAMELGARVREQMMAIGVPEAELPQVVIVGNGSVDDPSGIPMYNEMLEERRKERFDEHRKDIILMRLKHNYIAMNALMTRREGDGSMVGMQTSLAEGLETRISDWIGHGVPVVIANRGGMPLQVVDGESGMILDFNREDYDLDRGAGYITELLVNPSEYARTCASTERQAHEFNEREFTTTANAMRIARTAALVLDGKPIDRRWQLSSHDEHLGLAA